MTYPCTWPTAEELKLIVNVDPNSSAFDTTLERQMAAGIALVKQEVGEWDDLLDCPDDMLQGAALRAAYLLSLRENPTAIVLDQVFMTYMSGHHRRFAIA